MTKNLTPSQQELRGVISRWVLFPPTGKTASSTPRRLGTRERA
jgi:hypothetical protein